MCQKTTQKLVFRYKTAEKQVSKYKVALVVIAALSSESSKSRSSWSLI